MPRPPAQVAPYVEALGSDGAVAFLLAYGGAELTVYGNPHRAGHVRLVGQDAAERLAAVADGLQKRVPLANRWLAKMLAWQGMSTAEIARRLRKTDVAVRGYLRDERVR